MSDPEGTSGEDTTPDGAKESGDGSTIPGGSDGVGVGAGEPSTFEPEEDPGPSDDPDSAKA